MPEPSQSKAPPAKPETALRIHSLLHTMHVLQQHEDRLCTIMHTIERAGKLKAAEIRELHMLLDHIPGDSLLHELNSVRESLPPRPDPPPARPRKAASAHAH